LPGDKAPLNMLHVATVHWRTDRWIGPQLRYLERNVRQPFRIYADLEGIDANAYRPRFHHLADLAATRRFENPIYSHTEKLNALAGEIARQASPDDVIVFLDGDAFPIAPLDSFLETTLARFPLVAVRREENLQDVQPHPSFSATTVGFWEEIGGDWDPSYTWRNAAGKVITDAGGNLLGRLREREVEWYALRRTNRRNLRPLWGAVYDDVVYHHGAGFRGGLCRRDREAIGRVPGPPPDPPPDASLMQRLVWTVKAHKWSLVDKRPVVRCERRVLERNRELSERVYACCRTIRASGQSCEPACRVAQSRGRGGALTPLG
jgi:hypothetical protein